MKPTCLITHRNNCAWAFQPPSRSSPPCRVPCIIIRPAHRSKSISLIPISFRRDPVGRAGVCRLLFASLHQTIYHPNSARKNTPTQKLYLVCTASLGTVIRARWLTVQTTAFTILLQFNAIVASRNQRLTANIGKCAYIAHISIGLSQSVNQRATSTCNYSISGPPAGHCHRGSAPHHLLCRQLSRRLPRFQTKSPYALIKLPLHVSTPFFGVFVTTRCARCLSNCGVIV